MLDRQRVRTFLLGGLAGVVAGMLFAPRSGKETRGSISTGAGAVRERGRESLFETRERLEERLSARRYRSPGGREARSAAPGASAVPPDVEPPLRETPPESPGARPHLRGVPRPVEEDPAADAGAAGPPAEGVDPEDLRRRISETRSRLRARLDEGRGGGPSGRRDD
jgi:hypothetical protein